MLMPELHQSFIMTLTSRFPQELETKARGNMEKVLRATVKV